MSAWQNIRKVATIALAIGCAFGASTRTVVADDVREVRFLYVVPSDRAESPTYSAAIRYSAQHFRSWLSHKLDGVTFRLANPAVRIARSDKPASWFSATGRHEGWNAFYRNTLDELTRLGIAKRDDPDARYVVYVDADHACGQSGAGGNGLAVVSANDLRGISGEAIVPACHTRNGAEIAARCRWIGGMGHELLHTFGLGHSDRLPECQTSQCRSEALMKFGYITYPQASLLAEEKTLLRRSDFLRRQEVPAVHACGDR